MPEIFISHASSDNQTALELRSWLVKNGFDQVFLDLDPERGIQAGDKWQEALLASCRRCEAVIFLISQAWLLSNWCVAEYLYTRNFGKRCLPVLIENIPLETIPDFLTAEYQLIDLVEDSSAYKRLILGLEKAGIAAESFTFPEGRRPYPGLQALTEDDAAIFFGRDAQILEALDELRRMSAIGGAKRLFIILGASGSGKSSLLRAGLMPRLLRDDLNFLTLPVLRPDRAALSGRSGLWAVLEGAAADHAISGKLPEDFPRNRSMIADLVEKRQTSLLEYLGVLRKAAAEQSMSENQPTLILAIDQGEELFGNEGQDEVKQLLKLIGQVLQEDNRTLVIIAMRSDAYPQLQAVELIPDYLHAPFNLGPMRSAGYKEVIERPAHLIGLKIEPRLTEALLAETEGADALPLLAYTLERLHRQYGADGELKLEEFQAMGGMEGVIASAVEDALRDPPRPLPTDQDALYALLRKVFIPHLVQADETGAFTRRIAQKNEIPNKAHPLIELLVDRRLLVLNAADNGDTGNETIEIAHEALMRSWPLLASWLQEERNFLAWRTSIAYATRGWEGNVRGLLTHKELLNASDWLSERPNDIREADRIYIEASAKAEADRLKREYRRRQKNMLAALAASGVLLVLLLVALWQWQAAETARDAANVARKTAEARELVVRADTMIDTSIGKTTQAAHLVMASLKLKHTVDAQQVLDKILRLTPRSTRKIDSPWNWSQLQYSPEGNLLLNWRHTGSSYRPAFGDILHLDPETLDTKRTYRLNGRVWPAISPGGEFMAISGYARKLKIVNLKIGEIVFEHPYKHIITARFDGTGQRLFVARGDGVLETRQAPTWKLVEERRFEVLKNTIDPRLSLSVSKDGKKQMVATWLAAYIFSDATTKMKTLDIRERAAMSGIDPTGSRAVTAQWDMPVILWDLASESSVKQLLDKGLHSAAAFSPNGARFASATEHGDIFVWEAATGKRLASFVLEKQINMLAFSEDGDLLASGDQGGAVHIWDINAKKKKHRWQHDSDILTLAFGNSSQRLYVGDKSQLLIGYDLTTGQESVRRRLSGAVFKIEVEPQSGVMAVAIEGSNHRYSWMDMRATNPKTGELLWQKEQNGGFTSLLFSPDGTGFATTEVDGFVKIWDAPTGTRKVESMVAGYRGELAYSPDGRRLVARKQEVAVIDSKTGKKLATIGEPGGIRDAVYNASKKTLITYGTDFFLQAWDVATGRLKWQWDNPSKAWRIQISGDGSRYLEDHSEPEQPWQIFETHSGRLVAELPPMRGGGELSDDGRFLVRTSSGLRDRSQGNKAYSDAEIWNLDTGNRVAQKRFDGNAFVGVRFLPANRVQILSRQTMEVLDASTGRLLWDIKQFKNYSREFSERPVRAQDPLIVRRTDFTEFRDQQTGQVLTHYDSAITGVVLPHKPWQMVAINIRKSGSGEKGYSTALINWNTGKEIWRVRLFESSKSSIRKMHFSPDGLRLLLHIGGHASQLMILDLKDGKVLGTLQTDSQWSEMWPLPDPDLVLAKDYSDTVRVWRLSTGDEVNRFSHTHTADGFAAAQGISRVVTYTKGALRLWDLETLQQIAMRHTQGSVFEVAIRSDGRQVAYLTDRVQESNSGAKFHRLVLWDVEKDALTIIPVDSHSGNLVYDATGKRLAFRMGKNVFRVLDVDSLKLLLQTQAFPGNELRKAMFSSDSTRLIGDESGGYRVWNISSKEEIARLDGRSIVELPGTTEIALRGREGWRVWDVLSGDLKKKHVPELFGGITASADDAALAGYNNDKFWMMDVKTGETIEFEPEQKNEEIKSYALSELRNLVVLAQRKLKPYRPGTISLRRLPTGRELAKATPDAVTTILKFADNNDSILLVGTPGNWAIYGEGTSLFLWRWREGIINALSEDQPITDVAVSPDGSIFATAEGKIESQDAGRPTQIGTLQLRIWDASSGKILRTIPIDTPIRDVVYSPDGRFLAAGKSHQIVIFNTDDWSVVKQFDFNAGIAGGKVLYIADNRVIASASKGIQIWNPVDDSIFVLPLNANFPGVRVSKSGSTLAVEDGDWLRVWDLERRSELLRRQFKRGASFAFAGEMDRLFAYQSDLGLAEIPWRTQDLIKEACRRLPPLDPEVMKNEPGAELFAEPLCPPSK